MVLIKLCISDDLIKKISGVFWKKKGQDSFMLSVVLNWLYILLTTSALGIVCAVVIKIKLKYQMKEWTSVVMAGIVAITVYAQFFSLFYKVGMAANLLLCVICFSGLFMCYITQKDEMTEVFCGMIRKRSKWRMLAVIFLFILWAYFTSGGIMHYDSDLYHAQSIRWIEEYGVIKGLANLQVRFAYNSSFFALSAIYSTKFLTGHSLHIVNGFLAFILSVKVLDLTKCFKKKSFRLSDFARMAAFYYLTLICDEVVSPASDYAIMCTVFFLIIEWLTLMETEAANEDDLIAPYALLCVTGVFALTLKLTAGQILLLVIKPAASLIKEKRWKHIFVYLTLGIITAFPWFARTVIISGYLLYPFPTLDLFSFDWKLPANVAAYDAAEIKVWGRALYDISMIDVKFLQWFPNWFSNTLSRMEKLIISADVISLIFWGCWSVIRLYKTCKKNRNKKQLNNSAESDVLLVIVAVAASYLFWQYSAPLTRYGYAYMLLMVALTCGYMIKQIKKWQEPLMKIVHYAVLIFIAVKLALLVKNSVYIAKNTANEYLVWQQPYGSYEVQSCQIENETFYYPTNGDRVGYEPFPSSTVKPDVYFRGESIKDGFVRKKD